MGTREARSGTVAVAMCAAAIAALAIDGHAREASGTTAIAPPAPGPAPLTPEVGTEIQPGCMNLITLDSCCASWIGAEVPEVCCPQQPTPDGIEWCCPWFIVDASWRTALPYTRGYAPGTEFPRDHEAPCRWGVPLCGPFPGECEFDEFPSGEKFCESLGLPIDGIKCPGDVGVAG